MSKEGKLVTCQNPMALQKKREIIALLPYCGGARLMLVRLIIVDSKFFSFPRFLGFRLPLSAYSLFGRKLERSLEIRKPDTHLKILIPFFY